jgi:hypothetical protein
VLRFSTDIGASADVEVALLREGGLMDIAKVAFVADPLAALDASIDTTVGLMHAVPGPRR